MKVAELLARARETVETPLASVELGRAHELANAVIAVLGEVQPCGMPEPEIVSLGVGECGVLVDPAWAAMPVAEARAFATMILHVADEAEEQNR